MFWSIGVLLCLVSFLGVLRLSVSLSQELKAADLKISFVRTENYLRQQELWCNTFHGCREPLAGSQAVPMFMESTAFSTISKKSCFPTKGVWYESSHISRPTLTKLESLLQSLLVKVGQVIFSEIIIHLNVALNKSWKIAHTCYKRQIKASQTPGEYNVFSKLHWRAFNAYKHFSM